MVAEPVASTSRIGIDVGGTFTDVVYYDEATGVTAIGKVPTTPSDPIGGIRRALEEHVPAEIVERAAFLVHGTTVGLNSLLERTGPRIGLLATEGFRDVIELCERGNPWDPFWKPRDLLVDRALRVGVRERIRGDGRVETALVASDVERAAAGFAEAGVSSVAIAFVNAYRNPRHESLAADILRSAGFDGMIAMSHEISGEYREYERTCTTLIEAYVRPGTSGYLGELESYVRGIGFKGEILISRSGGGALSVEDARERTFETIFSGPVGGVAGTAQVALEQRCRLAVSMDIGGTSTDVSVIDDGEPRRLYEGRVAGLPLLTDWVDVRSIGAGGGSIVHVDPGGLMRVGPRSAGAEPGPVAYGRGGAEPTLTDAAVVLGLLGHDDLAGHLRLDRTAATRAFRPIAHKLDLSEEETAVGAITIATASMADAIRTVTIELGRDPREATLVAFGGAGPLFADLVAHELGVERVVIPPFAGGFSALGMLTSDIVRSSSRTIATVLTAAAEKELEDGFADLIRSMGAQPPWAGEGGLTTELELRYYGQNKSLSVTVDSAARKVTVDADRAAELFRDTYADAYGPTPASEIEVTALRARYRRKTASAIGPPQRRDAGIVGGVVPAFSFSSGGWVEFRHLDIGSLAVEEPVSGPAIIADATSNIYVDVGSHASLDASGCVLVGHAARAGQAASL